MDSIYNICSCGSNKKFKFCCYATIRTQDPLKTGAALSGLPVFMCMIDENWKDAGIANILVTRKMPNNNYIVAIYLVDFWCLGVKNVLIRINIDYDEIHSYCMQIAAGDGEGAMSISYEEARSMILGSIKYAKHLGFNPHPDWQQAKYMIEFDRTFEDNITFGKDGKPFYVEGPNDKKIANVIINQVVKFGGNWMKVI